MICGMSERSPVNTTRSAMLNSCARAFSSVVNDPPCTSTASAPTTRSHALGTCSRTRANARSSSRCPFWANRRDTEASIVGVGQVCRSTCGERHRHRPSCVIPPGEVDAIQHGVNSVGRRARRGDGARHEARDAEYRVRVSHPPLCRRAVAVQPTRRERERQGFCARHLAQADGIDAHRKRAVPSRG